MAAPGQNGYSLFLLTAKFMCTPGAIKAEQNTSSTIRQYPTIGTPKYPWTHPQFYIPFWRNKPRHTLSLQTRSVGAPKGCFCLFSLSSERVDKKNVKSSILRKKTSKFLSSLPFKTQTIDNQWEYDDASEYYRSSWSVTTVYSWRSLYHHPTLALSTGSLLVLLTTQFVD